ncbi:LysM peptidoglycan-binding domain-containing protein, partial [Micromonospora sp. NPDC049799]|uniref:LysM peptidoglycan-binding domain-containing protein n=1 Tax=Micromonospora sp. NPDC049799 TaxID=3154741 RepID=UPI0033E24BAE
GPYALPATATVASAGAHTSYAAPSGLVVRPAAAVPNTATPLAQPAQAAQSAQPGLPKTAAPVYRVAKGDHLGAVAERYLDRFGDYRDLAELNRLADPDRIHPGQLLRLPAEAHDQGARSHANGRLVSRSGGPVAERPAKPVPVRPAPSAGPDAPQQVSPAPPAAELPDTPDRSTGRDTEHDGPVMTVGAARPGDPDRVNRPLAISAVLAVSSIVGAQIGAVLGLRRRPATVRFDATGTSSRDIPVGRHRRS